MKNENENKKERKIIPIFKMDGLVHHSDYMAICGVEHSSSTTNMEYVSCVKCLELIEKKEQTALKCNTIYHGDCLQLMSHISSQSCDAILCDLPYGTTNCAWDCPLPFSELWEQYERIIKRNAPIILFGRQPFTSALVMSKPRFYKHKWVWNKKQSGSAINGKYMPHQLDEDIIVFSKGKVNYYPQMRIGKMRKRGGYHAGNAIMNNLRSGFSSTSNLYYPTNIIELANPRTGKLHPTEKPVQLIELLLTHYSKPNDLVLDNCMGSGSTPVACVNTGRRFIGIEKDHHYFKIASKRLAGQL